MASALLDRLEEAGITATSTDLGHATAGMIGLQRKGLQLRVWIEDASRLPRAEEILRTLLAEPRASSHCPGCGYDLVGHAGAITCPECGLAIVAAAAADDAQCPRCGAIGPADFELCWSCGATLAGDDDEEVEGASEAPVNTCRRCGAEAEAGASICVSCGAGIDALTPRRMLGRRFSVARVAFLFIGVYILLNLMALLSRWLGS